MAQGSVKQRGKRWYLVYPYRAPDGSYKRKWERALDAGYPDTQRGAEQALRQRLSELDDGHNPGSFRVTVADYLTTWHTGRHHIRPATWYNEGYAVRDRIVPYIGDTELGKLTRTDIRAWHAALLKRYKPSTISRTHQTLVTALNDAVEDRLVRENVAARVRPPKQEQQHIPVWNLEQIQTFLAACEDDLYGVFWRLIVMTGLRRGEAIALRWQDVDLKQARLRVEQTLTATREGGRTFGPPKTASSRRTVDLPASLVAALQAERDRQVFHRQQAGRYWKENGLVFTKANGQMLQPTTLAKALDDLIERCGLPRITPHQLRHSHATWMMGLGVPPKVASERLGHSRVGITLDLYSHVLESMQRDAADALDESLVSNDGSNGSSVAQES